MGTAFKFIGSIIGTIVGIIGVVYAAFGLASEVSKRG